MEAIENLLHRRTDLSTFVVHFTRATPPDSASGNLQSILLSKRLEARNVYGMAGELSKEFPDVAETQKVVCFTETPLEHAWMMCTPIENREFQFEGYGLAFTKTFARRFGVNPVWYLDITPGHGVPGGRDWLTQPINRLVQRAKESAAASEDADPDPPTLAAADILRLTPFIEQMGRTTGGRKEFWWEREWRYVGHFSFKADDIVAAFAPEGDHQNLKACLSTDPSYESKMPAFVDANWGLERMIATLANVAAADLGPFPR
ncbi:abortive infection system antitoxin AbiGi family protein [Streptomyces sp. P1-3]|uniref:abortive infection system antitoxin AbiGi family protein n=1 Tax=Streptomyces sp. P1-3 TaxID=3421658 RepID=UPI003D3679A4